MRPRQDHPSGNAAYQRLAARMEKAQAEQSQRFEDATDRILDSLRDLKDDVRRLDTSQDTLTSRVTDIERQVMETRETLHVQSQMVTKGRVDSAKQAVVSAAKSPWGLALVIATSFTAFMAAAKNVPAFIVGLEQVAVATWSYLKGSGNVG